MSLQYDSTVRNSENTVVQFTYGDDGLHPDKMENNDRPVDFQRLRLHVSQIAPCRDEAALRGDTLMELVEAKLAEEPFKSLEQENGAVFLQEIRDFFTSVAAEENSPSTGSYAGDDDGRRTWNNSRVTATQLGMILQSALERFLLAFVEPGEACGAMGAQSISEPGTQMTLKVRVEATRHSLFRSPFAGSLSHVIRFSRPSTLAGSHQ